MTGSLQRGWRSYFLISHLQELGVHVSGTLPLLVEQKLVVAAVSTNGYEVGKYKTYVSKNSQQNTTPPAATTSISELIRRTEVWFWLSPMTALGSVPKAHTHGEPEGTWNLEKLHLELKYFGRKLADAKLQRKKILYIITFQLVNHQLSEIN